MKNIKQYLLVSVLALCAGMHAMEKQYDLTIPLQVQAWAEVQGIPMTHNESLAFAGQQLAEKEFVLYSKASDYQKKNWDTYDLTNASHVAVWAMEVKDMIITSTEATTFAKVWKKQNLVHKIGELENKIALDNAISLSKQEQQHNNNNTPKEENDDLTNIDTVIRLAQEQGIIMTRKDANAYVNEMLDQQELAKVIATLDADNTPENNQQTKTQDTSDEVSDTECFLCMEDITPADCASISRNCNHTTHKACLEQIKAKHANCPVCNAKIE